MEWASWHDFSGSGTILPHLTVVPLGADGSLLFAEQAVQAREAVLDVGSTLSHRRFPVRQSSRCSRMPSSRRVLKAAHMTWIRSIVSELVKPAKIAEGKLEPASVGTEALRDEAGREVLERTG